MTVPQPNLGRLRGVKQVANPPSVITSTPTNQTSMTGRIFTPLCTTTTPLLGPGAPVGAFRCHPNAFAPISTMTSPTFGPPFFAPNTGTTHVSL